jgi:rhodanese-related sulfurtransferase
MHTVQEIDVETLAGWQEAETEHRLIDVRSESEFSQGMIPKSEHIPLHTIPRLLNEIEQKTEIVFYCRSGIRSAQACQYLASMGYKNVYNLKRGILGWAQQGLPLVRSENAIA